MNFIYRLSVSLLMIATATHMVHSQSSRIILWGAPITDGDSTDFQRQKFLKICSGSDHLLGLTEKGIAYARGKNDFNQINLPLNLGKIVDIAASQNYSLLLEEGGSIKGFGDNEFGQLDFPLFNSHVIAVSAGTFHALALLQSGRVFAWGSNAQKQSSVPANIGIVTAIAAGGNHSLALTQDGRVAAWGENNSKQTDVPRNLPPVKAIAAGSLHSLALTTDGRVVAWGFNKYGQTEVPTTLKNVIQISAGANFSMALTADGSVVCWGDNRKGQCNTPSNLKEAGYISAGGYRAIAIGRRAMKGQLSARMQELKEKYSEVFKPKGEFETSDTYTRRLAQQEKYIRGFIGSSIKKITVTVDKLGMYNADLQEFELFVDGKSYKVKVPLPEAPSLKQNIQKATAYATSLWDDSLMSVRKTNIYLIHPGTNGKYEIGSQENLSHYDTTQQFVVTKSVSDVKKKQESSNGLPTLSGDRSITGEDVTLEKLGIEPHEVPAYYALIIGVSDYKLNQQGLPDLDQPANDSKRLAEVLIRKYWFDKQRVVVLPNANKREVVTALETLATTVTGKDNLLVFYAGHGFYDKAKDFGFWLPSDADIHDRSSWIPNSVIKDYLGAIQSRHTLLIADACFSGSIFKSRNVSEQSLIKFTETYRSKSRKAITSGNLTTVPDRSFFLEFLLKKLEDNTDLFLSAQLLFSRMYEPFTNNAINIPQFGIVQGVGDEGGDFIFIRR
jgi:hypothetical protein